MRRAGLSVVVLLAAGCAKRGAEPPRARDVPVGGATGGGVTTITACEDRLGELLDAERAEGLPIVDVCITGASRETTTAVRNALYLGPRRTHEAGELRRDLARAYQTGLVAQVEATARRSGTGLVLFLAVQEVPRISAVNVDGVTGLAGAPVLDELPAIGTPLSRPALHEALDRMRAEYRRSGWADATTSFSTTPDGAGRVKLRIVAVEGVRSRIGKVTFEGARDGRDAGLRRAVELPEGAPLFEDVLDRAAVLASSFYYDRGFLNVQIETPSLTRAADGKTAIVYRITEGPLFRIGKIRVKNADGATEKEILAGLRSKPGEVFSRSKVKADIEEIGRRSEASGKVVVVEPETSIDVKAGTVDLTLAVQ